MGGVSLIEYLNDPYLVVRVQQYFGVQSSKDDSSSSYLLHKKKDLLEEEVHSAEPQLSPHRHSSSSHSSSSVANNVSSSTTARTATASSSKKKEPSSDEVPVPPPPQSSSRTALVTNWWWYYLFRFGTELGDEIFYSLWFSFWFWNVDGAVGRRVLLLWAALMYIGQGLKDIIRWPRPASPPVIRLECGRWEMEYGMPSTHAVVGALVPFATLIFTAERYEYPVEVGVIGALLWCSVVCMSRLYLGMHSVLDVVAGLGLVGIFLIPTIPLVDALDPLILKTEFGGLAIFLVGVVLCFLTPGGDRWSPARSDTFVILGSTVGLMSGAWANYQLGIIRGPPLPPPYAVIWPSGPMLGLSLLRMIIGLAVIEIVRKSVKAILGSFFHKLLGIEKKADLNGASKIQVFSELSQKYLTYCLIGFSILWMIPALFRLCGIERPTFHTEI